MTSPLPREIPRIAGLLALMACSSPVDVITEPDARAPEPDAGPTPTPRADHCEPAGDASWVPLGNPLAAAPLLDWTAEVLAMHEGVIAAGGRERFYVTRDGGWTELPWAGLPPGRVAAIARHEGAWVLALKDTVPVDNRIFRFDEAAGTWTSLGAPVEDDRLATVAQLVAFDGGLLAHTQDTQLFAYDGAGGWRAIALDGAGDGVMDVVTTGAVAYASSRISFSETAFYRSTDGELWEAIPVEGSVPGATDLVAGPGMILASRFASADLSMLRLDESDGPGATLRVVEATSRLPTWIADDGTVFFMDRTELFAADSLEAAPRLVPDILPLAGGNGGARFLRAASEGSAIVLPSRLTVGMRIVRSDDRALSFRSTASAVPAVMLELASDGRELVLRVRDDAGDAQAFRLDADAWAGVTLPDPSAAGVSGIEGWLLTRTAEYADEPPSRSSDGGRTWEPLASRFPTYFSNVGIVLRRVSAFAEDDEGRLYAGTIGGATSVCCTGSMTGFTQRTGAGMWRLEELGWAPVNAGVPVEAEPDALGGPPFRSDVRALANTKAGLFASLVGRGVRRLVADRWREHSSGIPLDVTPELVAIGETAAAWWPTGLAVLEGGVWVPRGSSALTDVTARADLLVRADAEGVSWSNDRGAAWSELPPLEGVVELAITRDRLYARTAEHAVHALAIACTEGTL